MNPSSSKLKASSTMDIRQTCGTMDGGASTSDGAQSDPSVEEKRSEEEGLETIVNARPTSNRVPYKNGYGDFFFGRLPWCERKTITKDMSEEEERDLMGITGSNGVPVVELGNFQRYLQLALQGRKTMSQKDGTMGCYCIEC
jgi:hypothetical protein